MDITVKYGERTFGTGESATSYRAELSHDQGYPRPQGASFPHKEDWVTLSYQFDPAVDGYKDSIYGRSEAWVYGARITMTAEEAEELARLLLYSVEHAKITKAPVKLSFARKKKA
jgi:hypothetical protein